MKTKPLFVSLLLAPLALAQQERRWIETTPAGVFLRTAAMPAASAPAANPNPSPLGLRWTYPNPAGVPWISEFVSVGNRGTFAWLGQNLNGQRLSFLSTTEDASPTITRWETPIAGRPSIIVRAADKARAAVVAMSTYNAGTMTYTYQIDYLRGNGPTVLWSATIPAKPAGSALFPGIADDGRIVTVGYSNASDLTEVQVFDALSATPGIPLRTITSTRQGPRAADLSASGNAVLVGNHQSNELFNTATGAIITTDFSTVSHPAHTVNADGTTWARGGFDVGAWMLVGSTWTRVLTFTDPTLSFGVYLACDLSADGRTFAVAATDASNSYLPFRVYCWRLAPSGATLLWTYSVQGSGAYQDTPSALSISDSGQWIAVGSWGDQGNTHPEALLFKDSSNTPVGSVDTPGSVFDLDLSGDGQFLVVGTKSVHANTFGNGGEGYCLDRGGQGHRLKGAPAPGAALKFDTGGNVGDLVVIVLGTGVLATPLSVPGFLGTLQIDLAQPYIAFVAGTVPASGVHSQLLTVPGIPSVVGLTNWTQAVRLGPQNEFDNVIQVPFTL